MNYILRNGPAGMGPSMLGCDTSEAARKWAEDCIDAANRAAWRYAGREPCACTDLTTMESIAIAMAARVEMDYQFVMNTVRVTTRNKICITWTDGQFQVAVLQERGR